LGLRPVIKGADHLVYLWYMNDTKPIKRSTQLQPLSREHHDGLLFVWKLRQGISSHTDIGRLRDYTSWYWKNHIKAHFFQEEKLILPFLPAAHPLVQQLKKDHADIRELILTIDKDADRYDFIRLSNLLETHIRFEERELFQYLEEHLSGEQLETIHEQLEKHPLTCSAGWNDEFWTRKEKQ